MKLIATQHFPYGGKDLKPGDLFESTSDEDARLLKGFGKARGEGEEVSEQKPAQPVPPEPRKKRAYRRRDMCAENPAGN